MDIIYSSVCKQAGLCLILENVGLMSGWCFGSSRLPGVNSSRGPDFCSLIVIHTHGGYLVNFH